MEERKFRGRGRGILPVNRVSRSPSLSSPSTSSSSTSGDATSQITDKIAAMVMDASDSSGPKLRGRTIARPSSPTRGQPHRGFRGLRQEAERYAVETTRAESLATKKGNFGSPCDLLANYFSLKKATAWSIYHYRVDFEPETDYSKAKMSYLRQHPEVLGGYMYDGGSVLYTSKAYDQDPLVLDCTDKFNPELRVRVTLKKTARLEPGDNMYISFYNVLLKRCLRLMKLEPMGRGYFNINKPIEIPKYRLCLYPGFMTSIRNHEQDVLLCVENVHKVIRKDSVLDNLDDFQKNPPRGKDFRSAASEEFVGAVVMTSYNNKTYSISDIAWNLSPKSTFERKGEKIPYAQYYQEKYGLSIRRMDQPLLFTKPRKQDYHRDNKDAKDADRPVYLVPELCVRTGLSNAMRENFQLMKELATYLHQPPKGRVEAITAFMKTLQDSTEIQSYMKQWGVEFAKDIIRLAGRTMPPESIIFASQNGERPHDAGPKADWTIAFRSRKLLHCEQAKKWHIIVPQRDVGGVDNLVNTMIRVAKPLGFDLPRPNIIKTVERPGIPSYIKAIDELVTQSPDFLFVILPNNKADLYGAVKKKLSGEIGLVSQCYLAKNVNNKGLMAIATKVVVQINAKLGGEPWSISVPPKKMMVVGFDVFHATKATEGRNVAAMVASFSSTFASYFSSVSFYNSTDELSRCVTSDLMKCIHAYQTLNNGEFPERILFYRDGVGEGQLDLVIRAELMQVRQALDETYSKQRMESPKLTFIVVSKKINTRLYAARRDPENPSPGTVCDDVVTLPERYDFFLIPQTARQGAVSPTSFNVIYDSMKLDPDKIQRLTFKFCHLYFNWSGTVAVPAPCQYAHKLAQLTGSAIGMEPQSQLNYKLHFL